MIVRVPAESSGSFADAKPKQNKTKQTKHEPCAYFDGVYCRIPHMAIGIN